MEVRLRGAMADGELETETEDGVAVVGVGCHFPGGEGLDSFWKVLLEGRNCAGDIPAERFDSSAWYHPEQDMPGRTHTARAALLEGFNQFDAKFFGIPEAEADFMDPQQKLLLQCSFRALEDAGVSMESISGSRTGVYIGLMNRDYEMLRSNSAPTISHYTATGTATSVAANRLSFVFNLTGPSFAIDSACSSSLVALHVACQALRHGDCELALCGGVSCIMEPRVFVALSKAGMISADGTSRPFCSSADGYGRGEGCGVVLLKPLKEAVRDHNKIWGVVSRTAVNQDGHTVAPMTKPSSAQQEDLLRRIYGRADLLDVQYVEAHGTGTPVGDPTEAGSISSVLAKPRPAGSYTLRVGSVKGNIGHTESAAGVAGLIKVLLMMKHRTIVPSVFYSQDRASVDAQALNIKVPTAAERWDVPGRRVAGVNNFGFGGTNAHAIIKEHKATPTTPRTKDGTRHRFFVMSANSAKSLVLTAEDTVRRLDGDVRVDLDAVLYTAACRRTHHKHKHRRAVLLSPGDDPKVKIVSAAQRSSVPALSEPRLVFVFCGNGLVYRGMCRQLLRHQPAFRDKVRQVGRILRTLCSLDVEAALDGEADLVDLSRPEVAQPLLFAVQVGVAALLRRWGVKPDAVLGHSVGEVAAAHCSGLLSLEDAVKVIHLRSLHQSKVTGGKMLVVGNMAVPDVEALLPRHGGRVCVAAYNSPRSCTLSGEAQDVGDLHRHLTAADPKLFLRLLEVPAAYHSHMMEPILPDIQSSIGQLGSHETEAELFSTVTGQQAGPGDFCSGAYWARNIRQPVAFTQAVTAAVKGRRNAVFVEVGPRPALQRNIVETLGAAAATVLPSVLPDRDEDTALSLVSKLFELGVDVDWAHFYRGREAEPVPFPRYQFDTSERDVIIGAAQRSAEASGHPLLRPGEGDAFSCNLAVDAARYLLQHRHNGVPIVPGAFYADMGLAANMAAARPRVPLASLTLSVSFHSPFVLGPTSPEMKVQLERTETGTGFTVLSPAAVYASGTVVASEGGRVEEQRLDLKAIARRCSSVVSAQEFYSYLEQGGFQYGDIFQNQADVHYGPELREAFATISVPEELRPQLHECCVHPVVLDYMMQLLPVSVGHIFAGRPGFPARIGSLTVSRPLQDEMVVYLRAVDVGVDDFQVCGCFADKEGRVLVEVKHAQIRYLGSRSHVVDEYFYHHQYRPVHPDAVPCPPPRALVFCDHFGVSEVLKQHLDPRSRFVDGRHAADVLSDGFPALLAKLKIGDIEKDFDEVLFMWGQEQLLSLDTDAVLQNVTSCCETLRRVVLELKLRRFSKAIRTVTFGSSDLTLDHINPGFALVGMTRSFEAEIPELSFQLVDISSASDRDVAALSRVLRSCPCSQYPELVVKDGTIWQPSIVRTEPETPSSSEETSMSTSTFASTVLQTADAHQMLGLTASVLDQDDPEPLADRSVEIRPAKISVHSADYFPVSASHLRFGETLYWDTHSSQSHRLLALDFCGTVTAVGRNVRKLKVGDGVASCYPVEAGDRLRVPEDACYSTKRFPFLQRAPCVSFFVLAWEILHRLLPKAKQQLGIVSPDPDSALTKVLELTSHKSGWTVIVGTQCNGTFVDATRMDAFVLLPPFDEALIAKLCSFPGVQNVVAVCESQSPGLRAGEVLLGARDGVHVQLVQLSAILQKGTLSARRPHVHHWLKSLNLSRKFSLASFSLQGGAIEPPQSYFSAKSLAVVALQKEAGADPTHIPLLPRERRLFRRRAAYVVAGGLSGLGLETVKFISQRGGGQVVVLSRSKPSEEVQAELRRLERQSGCCITCLECDVSVRQQVAQAVEAVARRLPGCPVRGVFHSAVVLHDGLIETLDRSLYEKVLRPKVSGALNLHQATLHCPLEYFVCYSSISAFLGNASQTNYAAANTFLDLFCQYRRRLGLPGQSINWGALNLGLLLNKEHFQRFLEAKGMMVLEVAEIHKGLEQCLLLDRPQQAVCRFHFRNIRFNILSQNAALTHRLSALVNEAFNKSGDGGETAAQAEAVSPRDFVVSLLSETTGVERGELGDDSPLASLGVDSMQAMTLQNLIFQERGVNLSLVNLLDPNATLDTVVRLLSGDDGEGDGAETRGPETRGPETRGPAKKELQVLETQGPTKTEPLDLSTRL